MKITFTGVDRRTTKSEIEGLLADERVEIGVLYSAHPEGRNRYMEEDEILRALEWCAGRAALHICGSLPRTRLLIGDIDGMVLLVRRIQVNGAILPDQVNEICRMYPIQQIITQHTDLNTRLLDVPADNHAVLVDGSGGRGMTPVQWVRPITGMSVGFAGGLGPANIVDAIKSIREVARDPFWIDMEGKIRDDGDWFNVWRCHDVLRSLSVGGAGLLPMSL